MNEKTIFALGFFDGVHLGHQALLRRCRAMADSLGCRAGAVTFDIPPAAFLQQKSPDMINTLQDRQQLLRRFGMEEVRILRTDRQTLSIPWRAFLEQLLEDGAGGFVCGDDFRFGCRGRGNGALLAAFAREKGLPWAIIPEQTQNGRRISSTRIRSLLETGDVEGANALLGHPHRLSGTVVPGKQLGRTIGIPTANLSLPDSLLRPAFGVYACLATVEGKTFPAVTNIGLRPTVGGTNITVEPWLLDFSGDLYGKVLTLEFYKFLRPERKFDSLTALQQEIQRNGEETRKFFEKM